MTEPIARFTGVTYWYPGAATPSIAALDLEIRPGLTLVAGSSGGGKSTLLRLLDGLVPQFHGGRIAGSAVVAGLDPFRTPIPRLAQRVGLVFQDVETQSVYGTVEREVAFGLENAAMGRSQMRDRVDEALEALSIGHLRGRRLTTLSGGERQRVQLAAVLAMRPALVALDEPTSQLDPAGSEAVLAACGELAAGGRAVVVAEHRLETLLPRADRLLIVENGRVTDAPPDVQRAPAERHQHRSYDGAEIAWEMRDLAAGPNGHSAPAVLEGLSLAGSAGEVVALVGPNGSGKTTLLRTLAGLIPTLAGEVRRPAGRTAYLPQNPGALLYLPTVRAEVELTLRRAATDHVPGAAGVSGALWPGRGLGRPARGALRPARGVARPARLALDPAGEMLAAFGLTALADRYPRDLSSGERQRVALAATLAGSPDLVLLDEPTRGMDLAARRSLVAAVRALTERGSAVVVATHDTDLAAELADRTISLVDGRAVEDREARVSEVLSVVSGGPGSTSPAASPSVAGSSVAGSSERSAALASIGTPR